MLKAVQLMTERLGNPKWLTVEFEYGIEGTPCIFCIHIYVDRGYENRVAFLRYGWKSFPVELYFRPYLRDDIEHPSTMGIEVHEKIVFDSPSCD